MTQINFLRNLTPLSSLFLAFFLSATVVSAQTPAKERLLSFEKRTKMRENSILAQLEPINIGPSVFSGRVTDVEVDPNDPTHFYVAYASGGLWETKNNGSRFEPIFDHESALTIGDIAMDWENNVLWVGTGEVNSSRSSYAGTGIFKSSDNGKTWQHAGLEESHHIGRIVLHPKDKNVVFVAVLGHLYSRNTERGIYKTTDGGASWTRSLFISDSTGCVDLTIDPSDPNTLYAAAWDRHRTAWHFSGAGQGSGIHKSSDGGQTWALVSGETSGFPHGDKTGRIGLTAGLKDGKSVLYACVDNQFPKDKEDKEEDKGALKKDDFREISVANFMALEDKKLENYLRENDFPKEHTAKSVKASVKKEEIKPSALVDYLEDANAALFDVNYKEAQVYRSDDGGKTWQKTHAGNLEKMHFSYGYYFSNIRCMESDPDRVYMIGFFILRSDDGGKTWENINGDNVHVDHHALWVNDKRAGHLLNGNDGGLNMSYDDGKSWFKLNTPPVGQFYAVAVDNAKNYHVYAGAQDNGVWMGPHDYKASDEWHQTGQYPYKSIMGGDGMQIQVDKRDNTTVYSGYQFGNYFRINTKTDDYKSTKPQHKLGERPLRFNWQTPIHLSKHHQDILYLGANKLYRSMNQGDDWTAISEDLTQGGKSGNVPYGTLTSISESPFTFGDLYVGSDDGFIWHSPDGGYSWDKISDDLPQNHWVSRVQASAHDKNVVYCTLNAYRTDDFSAYVYRSENQGKTWEQIGLDLPSESVNVIKEDPINPDLLYVGTDGGIYVSFDVGAHFETMGTDFPAVPVHDLAIQEVAQDLIIGTHGRSMYRTAIADLQKLNSEAQGKEILALSAEKIHFSKNWGKKQAYKETKEPTFVVTYYVKNVGAIQFSIETKDGLELNKGTLEAKKGYNTTDIEASILEKIKSKYTKDLNKDLKKDEKAIEIEVSETGKYYLQKGVYVLKLGKNGEESTTEFEIL